RPSSNCSTGTLVQSVCRGFSFAVSVLAIVSFQYVVRLLPAHPASIYEHHVPMHIITGWRTKEYRSASQVYWIAPASRRNSFEDLPITRLVVLQSCSVARAHVA